MVIVMPTSEKTQLGGVAVESLVRSIGWRKHMQADMDFSQCKLQVT